MFRHTVSASTIEGTPVFNNANEKAGKIEDVMIHTSDGTVAYLVLSYGGIFGSTVGDKRFAVPFSAFSVRQEPGSDEVSYRLNVSNDFLEEAPGFDKEAYPDFADAKFQSSLADYYGGISRRA